ncbi:Probable LRR receptor-like serine/threonine-protein kinase At3g47570 [Linum perenne]
MVGTALLVQLLCLCCCASSSGVSLSNETDRLALLNFKSLISGDPFGILSSWNDSIHLCEWYGVSCSERHHGRVTALNLSSNELYGSISPHVGNLSFLKFLRLYNNNFIGEIPPEIGRLRKLERLLIQNNSLGGAIPSNISGCFALTHFFVHNNKLAGGLPWLFGVLNKLQLFVVRSNYLTGSIPLAFGNLSSLQVFDGAINQFQGRVPDTLGRLKSLMALSLNINNLSGEIPASIFNLSSLKDLWLGYNYQLRGNLPWSLGISLPNLDNFDVAFNQFTGSIPPSLSNASNLILLQLYSNNFTGSMPSMANSNKLKVLIIGNNSLGSGKANDMSFLSSLTKLWSLTSLSIILALSGNRFTGALPVEVGNLKNLEYLDLSYNMLSNRIPSSLGSCIRLEYLYLRGNHLQGIIPSSLSALRGIQWLDLSSNNLSGPIPKFLESMNITSLLNLSHNNFDGEVPTQGAFKNSSIISIVGNSKLCGHSKKTLSLKWKIVISTISSLLFLTFVGSCCFILLIKQRRIQDKNSTDDPKLLQLSYQRLFEATNGFSLGNQIGVGSFGSVYKGVLNDIGENIKHKNLVRIVTVCSSVDHEENDFKALIYEFLANVVHCDLKPSNVLLDEDMVAHVGDFGLARFLSTIKNPSSSTIGIKGTIGYAPPGCSRRDFLYSLFVEYGMGNDVSIQGDIYSYGILLLELFTGKRPTDETFRDGLSLHNVVKSALSKQNTSEVVDPVLLNELLHRLTTHRNYTTSSSDEARKDLQEVMSSILEIGITCSSNIPEKRIDMSEVLSRLAAIKSSLFGRR